MMARIKPRCNHGQGTAQICKKGYVTIWVGKGNRHIDVSGIYMFDSMHVSGSQLILIRSPEHGWKRRESHHCVQHIYV
jgi:hypothetical protein